jgi:hypothetical protein
LTQLEQSKQNMFGTQVIVIETLRFLFCQFNNLLSAISEFVKHGQ